MTSPEHADRLIATLGHQQQLVDELGALAGRQRTLVAEGRTEPLLELLADRQRIVDALLASQDETGELARAVERELEIDGGRREEIRKLVEAIGAELDAVMRRDAEDQARLVTDRDRTRQELEEVGTQRQARAAYLRPPAVTNRVADQRG